MLGFIWLSLSQCLGLWHSNYLAQLCTGSCKMRCHHLQSYFFFSLSELHMYTTVILREQFSNKSIQNLWYYAQHEIQSLPEWNLIFIPRAGLWVVSSNIPAKKGPDRDGVIMPPGLTPSVVPIGSDHCIFTVSSDHATVDLSHTVNSILCLILFTNVAVTRTLVLSAI